MSGSIVARQKALHDDAGDRDGGGAMGAIFLLGPISALLFAIVAAVVVVVRTKPVAG